MLPVAKVVNVTPDPGEAVAALALKSKAATLRN
jgi:hypothetical protein